ncbi:TPA: DUF2787 domain-containing protein [Vibrio cholerae]|nr:DUF2787 domain-containing protein [Vibrio cholerae]
MESISEGFSPSISKSLRDMFSCFPFPLAQGVYAIQMTDVCGRVGAHPIQLVVEKIDDSLELLTYSQFSIQYTNGSSSFVVSNFFDFVNQQFTSSRLGLCEISDDVTELFEMYLKDAIARIKNGSVKIEVKNQRLLG